jgi:hypothetical protein
VSSAAGRWQNAGRERIGDVRAGDIGERAHLTDVSNAVLYEDLREIVILGFC